MPLVSCITGIKAYLAFPLSGLAIHSKRPRAIGGVSPRELYLSMVTHTYMNLKMRENYILKFNNCFECSKNAICAESCAKSNESCAKSNENLNQAHKDSAAAKKRCKDEVFVIDR